MRPRRRECPARAPSGSTTYTNLADGKHTFAVAAKNGKSALGPSATATWVVDTTAPTITLKFPVNNGLYRAATWSSGCPTTGLCGTASDATSVQSVAVAIRQLSSGNYWNGSAFASPSQVFTPATGTTPSSRRAGASTRRLSTPARSWPVSGAKRVAHELDTGSVVRG